MSNDGGYPVPLEMTLQNFGNHRNNRVTFGEPDERCFLSAPSGSGKTHIFRAMKYVLGQPIKNDNEVFLFYNEDEERVMLNHAQIEVTFANSGENYLRKYPKDEKLTLGLEAFRENRRKNRHYLRREDGTESKLTLAELQDFGHYNDQLMFIDHKQATIWTEKSPKDRYKEIARIIKLDEYQTKVLAAHNQFTASRKEWEDAETNLLTARENLSFLDDRFQHYQQKLALQEQLLNLEKTLIRAHIYESHLNFSTFQTNFSKISEEREKHAETREQYRNNIKELKRQNEKITTDTDSLRKELIHLKNQYKDLVADVEYHKRTTNSVREFLEQNQLGMPTLEQFDNLDLEFKQFEKKIFDLQTAEAGKVRELNSRKNELEDIQKGIPRLPASGNLLRDILRKKGIQARYLFQLIDFLPGQEKWHAYIEAILGNNRLSIVVEEKNRHLARNLKKQSGNWHKLLYPRAQFAHPPNPHFLNWTNILTVLPGDIPIQEVTSLLNLIFGGTYFAEEVHNADDTLENNPFARCFCLDGNVYRVYSQEQYQPRPDQHLIGAGARERQIHILNIFIKDLSKDIEKLKGEILSLRSRKQIIEAQIQYLRLLQTVPEVEDKKKQLQLLDNQITDIQVQLADPEKTVKDNESKIENFEKERTKLEKLREELLTEIRKLEVLMTQETEVFHENYFRWIASTDPEKELDENITEIIEDKDYRYTALTERARLLISYIPPVEFTSNQLSTEIEKKKSALEVLIDYSEKDKKNFENAQAHIHLLEREIEQFRTKSEEDEQKFYDARTNLETRLNNWQGETNRLFRQILNKLGLDGEMKFTRREKPGRYNLALNVTNEMNTPLAPFEESNFSGGETVRVSLAFQIAILTQTSHSYFLWDEFDPNIDDALRNKVAEVIDQFLPGRKLIGLSPFTLVPGYVRIFPHIILISKDPDGWAMISVYRPTENVRKKKYRTLDDAQT